MCALLMGLVMLGACSRPNIQNAEAVKQAVMEYLNAKAGATGLNMATMDLDVTSLSFQQDQARATIYFRLKTGEGGMSLNYLLDRKGDKWVVRSLQDTENPHGGGATGAGAAPGSPGAAPELPPNHPSVGTPGSGGSLPAGHPPVGSKQ